MKIDILIRPDGTVVADVINGQGHACITKLLAPLEELLGKASTTRLKPEYEWDEEVVQMLQRQKVQS